MFKGFEVHDNILEEAETSTSEEPPHIEGGDVLVADPKTVLIGVGSRTNEEGADMLTEYLFRQTTVERVMKIKIPKAREFMHLDTLMTFVDRRQVLTLPYLWSEPDRYDYIFKKAARQQERLMKEKKYEGEEDEVDFNSRLEVVFKKIRDTATPPRTYDNVLEGLGKEGVIDPVLTVYVAGRLGKFPSPEDHIIAALREQWNDAANVLALKPGQVICYHRNDRTQRALEEAGLEVVSFRGGELVRGRGGARCMTMPLYREPA